MGPKSRLPFFVYRVVDAATVGLVNSATRTKTRIDDIAVGLGGGLAKLAVLVGGFVLAAEVLGMPYEGVIAGLGVGGLAFAIASKDMVSNYIGAGILMSDRPFKKGDLIDGVGLRGTVEHVGMRSTRLRTADGSIVMVPNAKLSDGDVNNWGKSKDLPNPIDLNIGVAPDTPRDKLDAFVERLRALFTAQPHARPGVNVALNEIGPSALVIRMLGGFDGATGFFAAKHKLLGDILDLAREMGVQFAVPTSRVQYVGEALSGSPPVRHRTHTAAE